MSRHPLVANPSQRALPAPSKPQGSDPLLHTLAPQKQALLDTLMGRNNQGELADSEREELRALVQEAEEVLLANARLLAQQQQRLKPETVSSSVSA